MFSKFASVIKATQEGAIDVKYFFKDIMMKSCLSEEQTQEFTEMIFNVFESIPLILNQLSKAKTTSDVIQALVIAYKLLTKESVILGAIDMGQWIYSQLKDMTDKIMIPKFGRSVQTSMNDFDWCVETARLVVNRYRDVRNSPFVKKLKDLLCYFLSFGILKFLHIDPKLLGFTEYEALKVKRTYTSKEDFVYTLFEDVVWVLERCSQAIKLKSFSPFIHSGSEYSNWLKLAQKVSIDQHKMSSPEAFADEGFNEPQFHKDLDTVIDQGNDLLKYMDKGVERDQVSKVLKEIKIISIQYKSKDYAQHPRKPPFTILVAGDSKIAKSQFSFILFQQYGKVHKLDTSPDSLWTRNPQDQFMSGYRVSKWCVLVDDIAQYKPEACQMDPTIADIIMMVNGMPMVAAMADLEDKGRIPFKPVMLIGTTNSEKLNASAYFSCPLALRRRFPYIVDISVRKQYREDTMVNGTCIKTTFVDESKIPPLKDGEIMNIWNIHIKKLVARPGPNGRSVPDVEIINSYTEENGKDIYDFLEDFSHMTLEFGKHQSLGQMATNQMAAVKICETCFRPMIKCRCLEIQSGNVEQNEMQDYGDFYRAMLHSPPPERMTPELIQVVQNAWRDREPNDDDYYVSMSRSERSDSFSELSEESENQLFDCLIDANIMNEYFSRFDSTCEELHVLAKRLCNSTTKYIYKIDDIVKYLVSQGIKYTDQGLAYFSDIMVFYQIRKIKDSIINVGQRMCNFWQNNKLSYVCMALISGWIIYKSVKGISSLLIKNDDTCSKCDCKLQGNVSDLVKDEKPNPWVRDEILLSEFYVPSKSIGWNTMTPYQIVDKLMHNVVFLACEFTNPENGLVQHMPSTALCIGGFIYLVNNHCIPEFGSLKVYMNQNPEGVRISSNITFTMNQSDVYRIPECDLAFFSCRCTPPRMDIKDLFLKQRFPALNCRGSYIHCRRNESPIHRDIVVKCIERSSLINNTIQTVWIGKTKEKTIKGDCGSPMIAYTNMGPVIVGIHQFLGEDNCVGAVEVLRSHIDQAIIKFGPQIECGKPSFNNEKLGPLHQKSVLRWEENGQARVYGSTVQGSFRANPKSRVEPTIISEAAQEEGFVKRCDKPVMKGPEVWHNNVSPTLTQEFNIDESMLKECVNNYALDVIDRLETNKLSEIFILDDVSTLNGVKGVKFLDKVNRNTSMGYPYRKSKRNFLIPIESTEMYPDAVEYTPEIKEEIKLIEETYARGERYMPVFVMSLKDEPIPLKKIQIKKTRGFMGGPAAWQFVYRKYLLMFVRTFQLNPFIFEGAPGMNPFSCSWKRLYEYLTHFGEDRMVAGDYEKFDKRMSPQMILAAFDFIIKILQAAGWTEDMITPVRCIAADVAFPVTDVQGDFVEFFGSNPSGHALTVIINCIVNSLYMRLAYTKLSPNKHCRDFQKNVRLITYGDDNALGISPSIQWFNHTSIQKELATINVVYTMADKDSESVPFINIRDISFLKRRFVPQSDGRVKCPLEWASIDKMLTMCTASKSVGKEKQAIDTIRSALGEFYQYGREVFDENIAKLHRIVERSGISDFVEENTFVSYAHIYEAYWSYCCYKDCECANMIAHT